tara:strand:+ start:664 stop:1299 length:636 start_codon:yes stop_codon:yes gene_type:complete
MNDDPNLAIIQGSNPAKNLNRIQDMDENIKAVRAEFIGKPEVCHMLVAEIIKLRRDPDNVISNNGFWFLLDGYLDVILEHYDIRWILSICDTIVDIGDELQSAIAMNIVQCVNGTNIHHSILINAVNGDIDSNKLRHELKVPTWGGMITADIPNGDMIHNMMNRLDVVIKQDEQLNSIWNAIKDRGRNESNLVMNHFCNASNFEHQRKFFK